MLSLKVIIQIADFIPSPDQMRPRLDYSFPPKSESTPSSSQTPSQEPDYPPPASQSMTSTVPLTILSPQTDLITPSLPSAFTRKIATREIQPPYLPILSSQIEARRNYRSTLKVRTEIRSRENLQETTSSIWPNLGDLRPSKTFVNTFPSTLLPKSVIRC